LNFATIYHNAIRKHSDAITRALHTQVPDAELKPFGPSGNLAMVQSRILVSISPRNGLVLVQDTADMASPGRVARFAQAGEAVTRQPQALAEQVAQLKFAVSGHQSRSQFWCTLNVFLVDHCGLSGTTGPVLGIPMYKKSRVPSSVSSVAPKVWAWSETLFVYAACWFPIA
jgi:hypothetical protein